MKQLQQYLYYIIIAIISGIVVFFVPLLGSDLETGWNLPTTAVGWVVFCTTKVIVAVVNVLLFHCFMEQAKVNIEKDPGYLQALHMLYESKDKEKLPRSPGKWNAQQYGFKGATIFAASVLSTVALTQAVLTFDWVSMLTYLTTIIFGVIFGIISMKSAEHYWTYEFLEYATYKINKEKESTHNA